MGRAQSSRGQRGCRLLHAWWDPHPHQDDFVRKVTRRTALRRRNDKEIKNFGESAVEFTTDESYVKWINFQRAEVGRILIAADKISETGGTVILNKRNPRIITKQGQTIRLKRERGMYFLDMWIRVPVKPWESGHPSAEPDGKISSTLAPVFPGSDK